MLLFKILTIKNLLEINLQVTSKYVLFLAIILINLLIIMIKNLLQKMLIINFYRYILGIWIKIPLILLVYLLFIDIVIAGKHDKSLSQIVIAGKHDKSLSQIKPKITNKVDLKKNLFKVLKEKNIIVLESFNKLINNNKMTEENYIKFLEKITVFFENSKNIKNTACLTTMLFNHKHILNFIRQDDESLKKIAQIYYINAISSMFHHLGFPNAQKVIDMLNWDSWKIEGIFNAKIFTAISYVYNSRYLPNKDKLDDILSWNLWKKNQNLMLIFLFR